MEDIERIETAYYAFVVSVFTRKPSQFWYHGTRYVRCDSCGRIVPTDDCSYYGGEGPRMLFGGCRSCFGKGR